MIEIREEKVMPLSNIFVLKNIPPNYDKQNIKDYVESTLDIGVDKVITNPINHEKALVFLEEKLLDFQSATAKIKAEKLESQELSLMQTHKVPAVVVTENDFAKLEKEFLQMYLEVTFGGCDDVVQKCDTWPSHKVAVVHFYSKFQKVVEKILTNEDHIPLPSEDYHIKMQPCYYNFNDTFPLDDVISTKSTHLNANADKSIDIKDKHNISLDQSSSSEYETDDSTHSESEEHISESDVSEKSSQNDDSSEDSDQLSLNDEKELKDEATIKMLKKHDNNDENPDKDIDSENSCKSDNNVKQKSIPNKKARRTTFRGRGRGMGPRLSKTTEASKTTDMNDKDSDDSSSDSETNTEQEDTNDEINVENSHKYKDVEENSGDSDNNFKQKSFPDKKVATFRGRGSGLLKTKLSEKTKASKRSSNNKVNIDDSSSDSETGVKQHSTSRVKVASFIGRGGSHMKPKSTEKVEESKVQDVKKNTSREKDVECNIESRDNIKENMISSSKTTTYMGRGRGLGRGLALTINAIFKESDAEDKSKKHSDSQHLPFTSRGNFTQRGRGINHAQMKVKTSLSETNSVEKNGHSNVSLLSMCEADKSAKLLSQRIEELERKKKEMAEENARLKEEIVQIKMTPLQAKCLEPYMKTFNECKVYYDTGARVAVLKGPHHVMQKYHCDFLVELRKVKETYIPLSTDVESILSSEKGKMFLQKLNSLELKTAFVELNTNSLVVASIDDSMLNDAVKLIKEKVECSETFNGKADIPLDKINTLKLKIEYNYMTKVIWDEKKSQLVVTGIKDDVLAARKDVENFLEDYGISERSFDVGDPLAKYFFSCLEDQIQDISKSINWTNYTFTKHQIALRFQGSKVETTQVLRKLEDLKIQTKTLKWDLLEDFKAHDVFLIVNCFKSGRLNYIDQKYLYKKVLLDFSQLSLFNLMSSESKNKRTNLKSKNSNNQVKVSTAQASSSVKSASVNETTFSVTNSCQLIIKSNGDIVQENSEILVSVLGTDLDLRKTRVGGAFHRACKSHWKEVNSSSKANPNSLVVTVKNPVDLKCMAVCHVILEPWDPNTSSSKLNSAIQQVLTEAKAIGAKTISFPPLGCGAAFKFPYSDVAQTMFQAFQSVNVGNFLQKIVLLAPDSNLLSEFKSRASTLYNSVQAPPVAASGSVPQASSPKTNPEKDISDDSTDDSDGDYLKLENISTNKSDNSTEVVITTRHENNFADLKKQLKQELQEQCLHSDYFNQDIIKYWPGKSRNKIVELAKKLSVWVERSPHPKSGCAGFLIKGEKSAVIDIKAFIQKEFLEISSHLPKKRMSSITAPNRGTLEFMQYAAESDEPFPSYWSLNKSKGFWDNYTPAWFKSKNVLVKVDQDIKDAISKLVIGTFDKNLVGKDRHDAEGLTHTSIKVVDVQRVENVELFEKFNHLRKKLFQKMLKMKQICSDIKKIPGSKGNIETTKCLSAAMKKELYFEVNEHYLFYGTDNFEQLIKHGIDPRSAEIDGLFGKGIYATEMSTKADQFSDSKSNRKPNGTPLTLILARVLLGNVFLCNDQYIKRQAGKKLSRPPCIKCLEDRCKCHEQTLFDSVMGDGSRLFRQFVIYEKDQFYPEYVITYVRE